MSAFIVSKVFLQQYIKFSPDTYFQWLVLGIIALLIYGIISLTMLSITDKATRNVLKRGYKIIKR